MTEETQKNNSRIEAFFFIKFHIRTCKPIIWSSLAKAMNFLLCSSVSFFACNRNIYGNGKREKEWGQRKTGFYFCLWIYSILPFQNFNGEREERPRIAEAVYGFDAATALYTYFWRRKAMGWECGTLSLSFFSFFLCAADPFLWAIRSN